MTTEQNVVRQLQAFDVAAFVLRHQPQFFAEWMKIKGYTMPTTPLERLIDSATGFDQTIMAEFVADVADLVIDRIPPECFTTPNPEASDE